MKVVTERLPIIESTNLKSGAHKSVNEGACVMELVSYIAGEPWSDHPECACAILTNYAIALNDRFNDEDRQKLKPLQAPAPKEIPLNTNFDAAFEYTIGNEGGYSNDPNDSGGPTNWGITIGDYSRYLGHPAGVDDVKAMTQSEAKIIYKRWYWDTLSLDGVNSKGVTMAMFDQGLVRGISTIAKVVQSFVGVVQDAHIGPITLAAINNQNATTLIMHIELQAEQAFRAIVNVHPKDAVFLNGWIARAKRLTSLVQYA